jgi:hypothetical protein
MQPRAGRGWFARRRPKRLRLIYRRTQGARHLIGALDLAAGEIHHRAETAALDVVSGLPDDSADVLDRPEAVSDPG